MNVSHASVHPVEEAATTEGGAEQNGVVPIPRARVKDIQGMPGTAGGLSLRVLQFIFAAAAISIMASTSDYPSVTAFCYLVAAAGLQTLWSFLLAIIDVYALLVRRSLQNYRVVSLFTIGDGVTSTLTFAAACASQASQSLLIMILKVVDRTTVCSLKRLQAWLLFVGSPPCHLFSSTSGPWHPGDRNSDIQKLGQLVKLVLVSSCF